jgi:hypothetical protein
MHVHTSQTNSLAIIANGMKKRWRRGLQVRHTWLREKKVLAAGQWGKERWRRGLIGGWNWVMVLSRIGVV